MSCKEMQDFLDPYIDCELDLVSSIDLERHLHDCPACGQLHTTRMETRKMILDESLRYHATASLEKKVRAALAQQDREGRKLGWLWFQWPSIGATAAALVLVAFLWVRTPANSIEREVIDSHVRSLMAGHLMDVPSTDQHTVKPWFAGKLDFSPPVEDLSEEGFPLIGGRLEYLDGHPAAAVVFRRKLHIINVFIWPASADNRGFRSMTQQGYHLVETSQGGMEYWLVSDLNDVELRELALCLTNPKRKP
jgi:anti-sigma factor RsiW